MSRWARGFLARTEAKLRHLVAATAAGTAPLSGKRWRYHSADMLHKLLKQQKRFNTLLTMVCLLLLGFRLKFWFRHNLPFGALRRNIFMLFIAHFVNYVACNGFQG